MHLHRTAVSVARVENQCIASTRRLDAIEDRSHLGIFPLQFPNSGLPSGHKDPAESTHDPSMLVMLP
jgi:hypothetical protein